MSTDSWIGAAAGGAWSTAGNWSAGAVPDQNSQAIIGSAGGTANVTLTIPGGVSANTIEVDSGSSATIVGSVNGLQNVHAYGGTITFGPGSSSSNVNLAVTSSGKAIIESVNDTFTNVTASGSGSTVELSGLSNYSLSNANFSSDAVLELDDTTMSYFSGNFNSGSSVVLNNNSSISIDNLSAAVTVNGGSTLTLTGNYNGGASVVMGSGSGNTVILSGSAAQSNLKISGVELTDKIGVAGKTVTSATYTNTNGSGSVTLTTSDGSSYTYSGIQFASDVPTGTQTVTAVNGEAVVCFLADSMIATANGEVAVQDIRIGDSLVAFDWRRGENVTRTVVWVGKARAVIKPDLPDDEAGYPVRIVKDAIAVGVPYKDMLITAEHCLFFEGKFVPARMLVNGRSISYDKSFTSYDYYHIETTDHSVIVADGVHTESYLDTGNRGSFVQHGQVVQFGAARPLNWDDHSGAPLCTERSFVEPLFHSLNARAAQMNLAETVTSERVVTTDADVRLLTGNGQIIRPIREDGDRVVFILPSGLESVQIASRFSRPSDMVGPFVDDRRKFGVLVGKISLYEGSVEAEMTEHLTQAELAGWNGLESSEARWTSGEGVITLPERNVKAPAMLSVQVLATTQYILKDLQEARAAQAA
ncbi:Hint domain-containing protein [Acetobacter sacchari]|uniref:Hint domain-containing protein n=1 Tax=Acetobacter sacchari TaxID=2661687 RepID=A0ABS3LUJ5_9PROT|nr:Hint domain-containing protein [Acetobacter sacchari]MBO1359588.1 Hint domain-containing protein [Acetobacter sacchari]